VDRYSRDAWADWESTTMWRGYTQHRGIPVRSSVIIIITTTTATISWWFPRDPASSV
jgi:hypothetical protein